jgi:uncharacterized protein YcbK (DUF882 family)
VIDGRRRAVAVVAWSVMAAIATRAPATLHAAPAAAPVPASLAAPAAASVATPAASGGPTAATAAKKDREWALKRGAHGAPPELGARPPRLVNLYNQWTHEWLAVDPSHPDVADDQLDRFLRCHYTNQRTAMEPRLLRAVVAAAAHFHRDTIDVVSGFRHPKYNLLLRKKGHQVARDSQHTHGNAIDFFLPDVTTAQLHAWAKAQHLGGVGLYLASGFVHMDTGPIRFWSGD